MNATETVKPLAVPTPSDAEVVRRVVAGDHAAFELLMRRHNQRVYRTIRSVLRDEGDVEDAMQQTYLQAFHALSSFEGGAAFSTWLVRIALNVALGRVRQRRRAAAAAATGMLHAGGDEAPAGPEDDTMRREAMGILERAIDRLPDAYRTVFVLREVEQLSTAEAAAALSASEDVVKVRLHRARLALRDLLAEEVGAAAPQAFAFLAPRCNRVVARVLAALGAASPGPAGGVTSSSG